MNTLPLWGTLAMLPITSMLACAPTEPNELDKLGTVAVSAKNLNVHAWIADDNDERAKGLMFVTAEELAPLEDGRERGMLFVFERDQRSGFWMRNTIIDLDIAYIRENGEIVQTFTMTALDESSYQPREAYRYALEVNAGVFAREGITAGDTVQIPDSVLKDVK
jgi:hypothetical protein